MSKKKALSDIKTLQREKLVLEPSIDMDERRYSLAERFGDKRDEALFMLKQGDLMDSIQDRKKRLKQIEAEIKKIRSTYIKGVIDPKIKVKGVQDIISGYEGSGPVFGRPNRNDDIYKYNKMILKKYNKLQLKLNRDYDILQGFITGTTIPRNPSVVTKLNNKIRIRQQKSDVLKAEIDDMRSEIIKEGIDDKLIPDLQNIVDKYEGSGKSEAEEQAMELYDKYLNDVYKLIGDKTSTYLGELNGAGRKLLKCKFKGVYSSDKIPKLNDLSPYCILNLDNSKQSGSHWIAVAKVLHKNECIVYDSFGRDYKDIIPNLDLSGNGRMINTDRDPEQRVVQTDCGQRSLGWLLLLDKHGYKMAKLI